MTTSKTQSHQIYICMQHYRFTCVKTWLHNVKYFLTGNNHYVAISLINSVIMLNNTQYNQTHTNILVWTFELYNFMQ